MNTSQQDHQEVPPHLEQKKLIEFLESLHRIVKIGIYYPAGHKVLDQAAEQFQRNISEVADTKSSARIELQNKTLSVEGHEIAKPTNALHEFKKLIADLGIGAIEIDRSILLPELLQFVKSLLLGRSQLQGVKEFTQAKIDTLPTTVRIVQKEFLVDERAVLLDAGDEDPEHGLNTVFQVLAEQGLERDKIEQCKKFLNDLTERFSNKPLNVQGLPAVTWSDVRGLLIKVVSNAYHLNDNSAGVFAQNELNAISTIFRGLQKEVKDAESQETINLLVSVFGGSAFNKSKLEDGPGRLNEIRQADKVPVKSAEQLQSFVNDNRVHQKTLEKINQIDRREELSILLQLLQWKQEPVVEDRIRQILRNILACRLNERETETLINGVTHLETSADNKIFYETVYFLTLVFRNGKIFSPLQFLMMICQKTSPAANPLLWPILINELLASGRTANQDAFTELTHIAAGLSADEMKERWSELEVMDSYQEKKIAADIFDPTLKNTFPLFSFLLDTTLKRQIGARILSSLVTNPPDWFIEAVAPLLQLSVPQHMKFLQIYLLVAQENSFTVNLRMAAGSLIVHNLPEISEQQMSQAWVVKTIQATPEMQTEETRQLLQRITEEKRMFIVPKWPNACRRAATAALAKLRRKP
ncbi:MAG: hypothetical protein WBB19_19795 [Desulforhopalus sp.]